MSARYDYSGWDGTQEFADLDPDDLLAGLTDDLLAGGDLDDALRRLRQESQRRHVTVTEVASEVVAAYGSEASGAAGARPA